jgi:hypothetical protein
MAVTVSLYWLDIQSGDADRVFVDRLRLYGVPLCGDGSGTLVELDKIRVDLERYNTVRTVSFNYEKDLSFNYNTEARFYIKYSFFEKDVEWRIFLSFVKATAGVFGKSLALLNDETILCYFDGLTFVTNSSDAIWDESSIKYLGLKHLAHRFDPI